VWTWDITKLRGPAKGIWFHLYVIIDIFSRFNPSWIVSPVEDSALATDFIAEAIERNGVVPHTARRPGHVDDIEAGVGAADRSRGHPVAFPAEGVQRQPVQ
jgi:transposase InsO family protein